MALYLIETEAFLAGAAARNTFDGAQVFKGDVLTNVFVKCVRVVVQSERIFNRALRVAAAFRQLAGHLSEKTAHLFFRQTAPSLMR